MRDKLKETSRSWWRGFTEKQKLSVSDSDDGSVKWYMYISPARILIGFVSLAALLLVAVVLVVAYTPVMDTIPGYPGSRSREMLIGNIMKLDSLEREMAHLTVYSDNIALIMEGKTPVVRDPSRIGDSIEIREKELVPRGAADSALRARMEGDGAYSLSGSVAAARSGVVAPEFVAPVTGLVQTRFSPVRGHHGVEIVTTSNHPVVAVREGSIIMSVWTPDDGYIVQMQHADNLVSIYRHLSRAERSVGSRVKAGESLGVTGASGAPGEEDAGAVSGTARPFEFELWYNGSSVDPENYIVF